MYNAQACQDVFVDKLLNKDNGFFLDIGAGTGGLRGYPVNFYSNTYFFETRNWNGIAIDYDREYIDSVKNIRKCKCLCEDLNASNINTVLQENNCPENIDYLSIDVDGAQWKVFNEFDFSKYKFKILTLEHNLFQSFENCTQNHTSEHKEKIVYEYNQYRKKLTDIGYKILWGNVILDGYGPVEDWYVNEDTYNEYQYLKRENINCQQILNMFI